MKKTLKTLAFTPRILSPGLRQLPKFLLVGIQKGGSSSLYKYICAHPEVKRAFVKEPNYFLRWYHEKTWNWYRAQFPLKSSKYITGEATPNYMINPHLPQRIHQHLPDVKIIMVLREPLARAISHYHHSVKYGWESRDLKTALTSDSELCEDEYKKIAQDPDYYSHDYIKHAYLHKGLYSLHLKPWITQFGLENLLIIETGQLQNQATEVYKKLTDFLEIKSWVPDEFKHHNTGNSTKPKLDFDVEQLKDYFETSNTELQKLLGDPFGWKN